MLPCSAKVVVVSNWSLVKILHLISGTLYLHGFHVNLLTAFLCNFLPYNHEKLSCNNFFRSNGAEPIRNRPPLFSVLDDKRVPRRPLNSTLNRSEHFESPSVPQNLTFSTTNNGLKNGSGYPPVHSGPSPFSKQFGDSGPKSGFNLTSPQSATDKQGWMLRQAIPTPPNQQNPAPYSIILQDEVQYQPSKYFF